MVCRYLPDGSAILDQFPWPPQQNNLYLNIPKRGRVKSSEYRKFEAAGLAWGIANSQFLSPLMWELSEEIKDQRTWIRIDSIYNLPHSMIWTKGSKKDPPRMKKMDAANRLKAQYDVLAKCLGIDDSFFYPGPTRKVVLDNPQLETPWVTMRLTLSETITRTEAMNAIVKGDIW